MSKWINERYGELYEIFGRGRPDEPLAHIGSLTAPSLELAKARARMMHAEKEWAELALAPASGFVSLVGGDSRYRIGFA